MMVLWLAACVASGERLLALPDRLPVDSADPAVGDSGGVETGETASPPVDTAPEHSPPVDTGGTDTPPDTEPDPDPCAYAAGELSVGEEWAIDVDEHTGDEATTEPKSDADDGRDGDNPYFQRHNVARAHCSGSDCYWYTSSHQESGEPSPSSTQYVDYTPPFADLGIGRYRLVASYRQTENRADYPARYVVHHRDGSDTTEVDQRDGSDVEWVELGTWWMCPDSYVRVQDDGSESITFNRMELTFEGE